MQSKSDTREQSAGYLRRMVLRAAGIALLCSLSLLAVVGFISHPTIAAGLDSVSNRASGALAPSANLYRPAGSNGVSDTHQVYLPIVERSYPLPLVPIAVQMYGNINATTGLTWVVSSGAKWIRVPISWLTIEPTNTMPISYDWSSSDGSILTASDAGIHFIGTLSNNPSWVAAHSCGPVTDTEDLHQFMGAVVARYPQVTYWEIYNEPDRVGECYGQNGAGYAALLQLVYPWIKTANPNAQVVMGGVAMDWFTDAGGKFDRQFLATVATACGAAGAKPCFDIANFHYYPGFRSEWETYGRDISGKAAFVRQTLAAHNYSRPLLNTETGWPATTATGSPELAARYVPKTFARALASELLVTNWFALKDVDASAPGLLDPSGAARPSFTALQTFSALLGQAKYVRAIPSSETGAARIEAYQFSAPTAVDWKRVDVYWYECPSMATTGTDCTNTVPLKIAVAPESEIGMIDKLGVKTILDDDDDGVTDGKVTLQIGTSPIYIDYQP
jgi:hypothetical protein